MTRSGDPVVGVLALQGGVREHVTMLSQLGARTSEVRTAEQLAEVDALVLPGGESTTIGRLLTLFDLFDPLQQRVRAGMPVLGSCAGMILLADDVVGGLTGQPLLGGIDMTVRRNAFGSQVESFEDDLDVEGLDRPLHAVFIRAPWVERVGDRVQVLARETGGHPVAVRQERLLATAFHPELSGDDRLHRLFLDGLAR